jgi:uncharacterized damage-inducible protein DinB
MSYGQWLQHAFEYDAWANRRWSGYLTQFKNSSRAIEIFQHMLNAQMIWLNRCGVIVEFDKTDQDLANVAENNAQAWRMFLDGADLYQTIAYTNMAGETFSNTVAEIATQVINHGTYHRGHLRGIAECEGISFQDTDWIIFLRESNGRA